MIKLMLKLIVTAMLLGLDLSLGSLVAYFFNYPSTLAVTLGLVLAILFTALNILVLRFTWAFKSSMKEIFE